MKPKKITILCNTFPPERGAAAIRLWHMAQLLKKAGHDVLVITVLPNYPTGKIFSAYRGHLWQHENLEGIKIFRMGIVPSNSSKPLNRALSMGSHMVALFSTGLVKIAASKSDIIIINTPSIVNGFLGSFLAQQFSKAKVVLNVSDLYPLTAVSLGALKHGLRLKLLRKLERRMYNRADAFLTQSGDILQHIQQLCGSTKPAMVYRNLKAIAPSTQIMGLNGHRSIVYAGLIGVAQGIVGICKAINFKESGTELHIYGDGPERKALETFIKIHPERGIFYHGSLPEADLNVVIQNYQGMLVPLIADIKGAVPSKIFMAMAHRKPILFMGNGEGASIIKEYHLGWCVPPADYTALGQAVQDFAQAPNKDLLTLMDNAEAATKLTFNNAVQDEQFLNFLAAL